MTQLLGYSLFGDEDYSEHRRVFVSFSSRDEKIGDLVRLLWARLEEQPLQVFRYETFRDDIPAGTDIDDACKAEIDRASYCMVVVSDASFESSWTRNEVLYALSLKKKQFIFPIILTNRKEWPAPYNALTGIKSWLRLNRLASSDFATLSTVIDGALIKFCSEQGLQYFPPQADLPRLPLRKRLYQEIWGVKSLDKSKKAQTIDEILKQCIEFSSEYGAGQLENADLIIRNIIRKLEREFPESHIYYPKIVKAMVDRDRANGNPRILREIHLALLNLSESKNPWIDANVHAMLGNLEIDLDDPHGAQSRFETASRFLTCVDPAIIHNRLLAATLSGDYELIEELSTSLDELKNGVNVARERNFYRLRLIHALVWAIRGQGQSVVEGLRELGKIDERDFDLVRQTVDVLAERGHLSASALKVLDAMELIAENYSAICWLSIVHRRAWIAIEMGLFVDAAKAIDRILHRDEFSQSLKLLTDACLIYHASQQDAKASSCLQRALQIDHRQIQIPELSFPEYDYHTGLAMWLDGNDELAKHYYKKAADSEYRDWYPEAFPWVRREILFFHRAS